MRGLLRTGVLLGCLFYLLAPTAAGAAKESRHALIFGNGAYRSAPLRNAVNDAEDMSRALSAAGFRVTKQINADRREMRRAIRQFRDRIRRGGIGLFFYAGHGMQVDGVNYLIPIGAKVERQYEVEDECLRVSSVLRAMEEARNRLNIIILDACRDNPFRGFRSSARGLARMDAPTGSLLAYATAPGSVASDGPDRNGLYTSKLLKHMLKPGLRLTDLFMNVRKDVMKASRKKQVPWETHSLTDPFFLIKKGAVVARPAPPPKAPKTVSKPSPKPVKKASVKKSAKIPKGSGKIIFQNNFDGEKRSWKPMQGVDISIENGNLVMRRTKEFGSWTESSGKIEGLAVDHYIVEALMRHVSGNYFGEYGVGVGSGDVGFNFLINDNGKYRLYEYASHSSDEPGIGTLKVHERIRWTKTNSIRKKAYNKLAIARRGDTLELYINDQSVDSIEIKPFKAQFIKLTVGKSQTVEVDSIIARRLK